MCIGIQKVRNLQTRGFQPTSSQFSRMADINAAQPINRKKKADRKAKREAGGPSTISRTVARGHLYLANNGLPHSERAAALARPPKVEVKVEPEVSVNTEVPAEKTV